jgi:TPR repeat protein
MAQRYLDGRGVPRSSTAAASWLWKSVAKQNAHADILLADLYTLGDGVSKNCDQARMLLVAAAKKNAPGAAEKLRNIESGGCH